MTMNLMTEVISITEYYVCKKCRGLKVKLNNDWCEFSVIENCEHNFVYLNVPRPIYKEKVIKKKVKR